MSWRFNAMLQPYGPQKTYAEKVAKRGEMKVAGEAADT